MTVLFHNNWHGGKRPYRAGEIVTLTRRECEALPKYDKKNPLYTAGSPQKLKAILKKQAEKATKKPDDKHEKTKNNGE